MNFAIIFGFPQVRANHAPPVTKEAGAPSSGHFRELVQCRRARFLYRTVATIDPDEAATIEHMLW